MRNPALLALVMTAAGCRAPGSGDASPAGSASAPGKVESLEPVGIPQIELRPAPMIFHPSLARVGQIEGDRCDVWDLDAGLYRGSIARSDCERWRPAARAVPEKIASATPTPPPAPSAHPDDPPQEGVGELVSAWSPDGEVIATGRRGAAEVRIWKADSGALKATVALPAADGPGAEPVRLEDLAWSPGGMLHAAALPVGVFRWYPLRADSEPRPFESNTRHQIVSLDPGGRYLGGSGTIPWQKSIGRIAAVMTLPTWQEKLAHRTSDVDEAINAGLEVRAVWAPGSNVLYAMRTTPIPAEACEDRNLAIQALDMQTGSVADVSLARAVLESALPSPDGRALLLSLTALGDCSEQYPGDHHASKERRAQLWRPDEGKDRVLWSVPAEATALTWSPRSDAVAFVNGKQVEIRGAERDELLGRFKGAAPLVFSPGGERIAFSEGNAFVIRERSGKGASKSTAEGVVAAAWSSADVLALATKSEVSIWDGKTGTKRGAVALGAVVSLGWDPKGENLFFATEDGAVRILRPPETTAPPPPLEGVMGYRRIAWLPDGALVILRDGLGLRFVARDGAWVLDKKLRIEAWEQADPSGRFTLISGPAVRRLEDGQVLHFDRLRGPFTEGYAFARQAPEDWVFREGSDVLQGKLVRAKEATFLAPTPDLVQRFASGAPIPMMKVERSGR